VPGEAYEGHILFISPTVDAASGSFRVTIELDQPGRDDGRPRLQPGMLVRLSIVTDRHPEALVVPKRALRREADVGFVFAVRDGVAWRIEVLEGFSTDEDVEIVPVEQGSLQVGEGIVVVGNRDLEDRDDVLAEPWRETEDVLDAETDPEASEEAQADDEEGDADAGTDDTAAEGEGSSTASGEVD
jgi:multidrug efflux pump subunit AcrA (membrane-fusion protein)